MLTEDLVLIMSEGNEGVEFSIIVRQSFKDLEICGSGAGINLSWLIALIKEKPAASVVSMEFATPFNRLRVVRIEKER